MLKNLFKKKKDKESPAKPVGNREIKTSESLADKVNSSTLPMLTHKLFMHYFDPNTKADFNNPEWKNQGIFFWTAKEEFEKKSLPPNFKNLEKRFFLINEIPPKLKLSAGKVMPWFGMPGNGEKYFLTNGDSELQIESLLKQNIIQYVEVIELTESNTEILTDRNCFRILLDDETMKYEPSSDKFFFNGKEASLGEAFNLKGIKIIKVN